MANYNRDQQRSQNREQQRKRDEEMTGSGTRRTEPLLSGNRGGTATATAETGIAPKRGTQQGDTPHPEQPAEGEPRPDLQGAERAEMGEQTRTERAQMGEQT
jgi:hypothetical protein